MYRGVGITTAEVVVPMDIQKTWRNYEKLSEERNGVQGEIEKLVAQKAAVLQRFREKVRATIPSQVKAQQAMDKAAARCETWLGGKMQNLLDKKESLDKHIKGFHDLLQIRVNDQARVQLAFEGSPYKDAGEVLRQPSLEQALEACVLDDLIDQDTQGPDLAAIPGPGAEGEKIVVWPN